VKYLQDFVGHFVSLPVGGATVNLPVTPISHIMHCTTLSERTCKTFVWPRDPFWGLATMPSSSLQDQCWFWHNLIPSVNHVSGTRKHNIGSAEYSVLQT